MRESLQTRLPIYKQLGWGKKKREAYLGEIFLLAMKGTRSSNDCDKYDRMTHTISVKDHRGFHKG